MLLCRDDVATLEEAMGDVVQNMNFRLAAFVEAKHMMRAPVNVDDVLDTNGTHKSEKVRFIVTLYSKYSKYTRALTLRNFSQTMTPCIPKLWAFCGQNSEKSKYMTVYRVSITGNDFPEFLTEQSSLRCAANSSHGLGN
jgi:hypothetical protein